MDQWANTVTVHRWYWIIRLDFVCRKQNLSIDNCWSKMGWGLVRDDGLMPLNCTVMTKLQQPHTRANISSPTIIVLWRIRHSYRSFQMKEAEPEIVTDLYVNLFYNLLHRRFSAVLYLSHYIMSFLPEGAAALPTWTGWCTADPMYMPIPIQTNIALIGQYWDDSIGQPMYLSGSS